MNSVFIASSIDGYIADKNGGLDWLNMVSNPENNDMGYSKFIKDTDAIVMGRNTFDVVCSFDIEWPYSIPVFVLSSSLKSIPEKYTDKAMLINGTPTQITEKLHSKGFKKLYIDGGKTIQGFLQADLIDEMIVTTIPILLGDGAHLFGDLNKPLEFICSKTEIFLNAIVQNTFRRLR